MHEEPIPCETLRGILLFRVLFHTHPFASHGGEGGGFCATSNSSPRTVRLAPKLFVFAYRTQTRLVYLDPRTDAAVTFEMSRLPVDIAAFADVVSSAYRGAYEAKDSYPTPPDAKRDVGVVAPWLENFPEETFEREIALRTTLIEIIADRTLVTDEVCDRAIRDVLRLCERTLQDDGLLAQGTTYVNQAFLPNNALGTQAGVLVSAGVTGTGLWAWLYPKQIMSNQDQLAEAMSKLNADQATVDQLQALNNPSGGLMHWLKWLAGHGTADTPIDNQSGGPVELLKTFWEETVTVNFTAENAAKWAGLQTDEPDYTPNTLADFLKDSIDLVVPDGLPPFAVNAAVFATVTGMTHWIAHHIAQGVGSAMTYTRDTSVVFSATAVMALCACLLKYNNLTRQRSQYLLSWLDKFKNEPNMKIYIGYVEDMRDQDYDTFVMPDKLHAMNVLMPDEVERWHDKNAPSETKPLSLVVHTSPGTDTVLCEFLNQHPAASPATTIQISSS